MNEPANALLASLTSQCERKIADKIQKRTALEQKCLQLETINLKMKINETGCQLALVAAKKVSPKAMCTGGCFFFWYFEKNNNDRGQNF